MLGSNQLRTAGLLGLLSGVLVLAGYYWLGNEQGLYLGLAFAGLSSFGSWYSDPKSFVKVPALWAGTFTNSFFHKSNRIAILLR